MKLFRHVKNVEIQETLPTDTEIVTASDGSAALQPRWNVIQTAVRASLLSLALLTCFLLWRLLEVNGSAGALALVAETLNSPVFWSAVAVGFFAQAVDGALGMAYGITSTTFLLSSGASPAMASASVHIAEVFTTGVSGISHARLGNVNKKLFLRLLVPGIAGGLLGAYVVTQIDGNVMKPFVSAYLLIMGLYILVKAVRAVKPRADAPRHVGKLALFGGFVDAAGGGGWGPVVTTSLVGSGNDPRTSIGSVNFAEHFLALATAASFAFLVGTGVWVLVAGLVLGGLFAAPFAALMVRKLKTRSLMVLIGGLITFLSLLNVYQALAA